MERTTLRTALTGNAARLVGGLLLVGAAVSGCAGKTDADPATTQATSPIEAPVATTPSTDKTYTEIADRMDGVQLWSNNLGTLATGKLALGTAVKVECLAPNYSGSPSGDPGYYEFNRDGRAEFAYANEFANGDRLGDPSGSTVVDPRVPNC